MSKRKKGPTPLEAAEAKAKSKILKCCSYAALFLALILGYALLAYLKGWQYKPDVGSWHGGSVFAFTLSAPIGTFLLSLSSIKTQLPTKTFLMSLLWFMLGVGLLTYFNLSGFLACIIPFYIAGVLFVTYKDFSKIKDPAGIR
jgi:hypothetical protein